VISANLNSDSCDTPPDFGKIWRPFFFFLISDEVVSSFGEVMSDEVVFLGGFYRFVGRFASGMKRELAMGDSPVRFGSGENRMN
jgi:hypothetical protein